MIIYFQSNTPRENYTFTSQQPFLIAVGPNKSAISQYFLSIDGRLINIPLEFSFIEAFDLMFKAFYIFNLQFDYDLENFYKFLSIFVYKIESREKATTRLIEINSKFQKLQK